MPDNFERNFSNGDSSKSVGFDKEEIGITIRSICTAFKHGCPINILTKEYYEACGEALPYRRFGYANATELLKAMPEVARFGLNKIGEVVVFAVSTDETEHVAALVRRQKSAPSKPSTRGHFNQRGRSRNHSSAQNSRGFASSGGRGRGHSGGGGYVGGLFSSRPSLVNGFNSSNKPQPVKNFQETLNFSSFSASNSGCVLSTLQSTPLFPRLESRETQSVSNSFGFSSVSVSPKGLTEWDVETISSNKKSNEESKFSSIGLNPTGFTSMPSPVNNFGSKVENDDYNWKQNLVKSPSYSSSSIVHPFGISSRSVCEPLKSKEDSFEIRKQFGMQTKFDGQKNHSSTSSASSSFGAYSSSSRNQNGRSRNYSKKMLNDKNFDNIPEHMLFKTIIPLSFKVQAERNDEYEGEISDLVNKNLRLPTTRNAESAKRNGFSNNF